VPDAVDLWFLIGGCWQTPRRLLLSEVDGAGQSMDRRLRDLVASIELQGDPQRSPNIEHLAILTRWHTSSWRDGEWIEIDWPSKIPYRKLVNAIARVAHGTAAPAEVPRPI
jgi:hypothetical protein